MPTYPLLQEQTPSAEMRNRVSPDGDQTPDPDPYVQASLLTSGDIGDAVEPATGRGHRRFCRLPSGALDYPECWRTSAKDNFLLIEVVKPVF